MRGESAKDKIVAAIAGRQHGVIDREGLRTAGLSDDAIDRRVAAGSLIRMHRGVFAVGHTALRPEAYWMAAVLACGPGAALSHASAAALWGIRPTAASLVDVVIPTTSGRRPRKGIRIHRTGLPQTRTHRGIPTTSPARTLTDLATTLTDHALARAVEAAEKRDLDLSGIRELVGRPGATRVLHHLGRTSTGTRSPFEDAFLALCRRRGIPRPETNIQVRGLLVDFAWPEARVVVEADSFEHHGTRQAFERDRQRDAILHAAGYATARYTHRQVTRRPEEVERALAELLSARGRPRPRARGRGGARR